MTNVKNFQSDNDKFNNQDTQSTSVIVGDSVGINNFDNDLNQLESIAIDTGGYPDIGQTSATAPSSSNFTRTHSPTPAQFQLSTNEHDHFKKYKEQNTPTIEHRPDFAQRGIFNRTVSTAASTMFGSHHSNDHDHLIPPPSTDREKSKMTRRYFATVISICWALFLIILGFVVFIGDAVFNFYPVAQSYAIFMISVALIYFVFLYIDIRVHVSKARLTIKERERRLALYAELMNKNGQPVEVLTDMAGNIIVSEEIITETLHLPPLKPVSHKYCFMTGRHGEFFYLKFGAAWFAFGLLIHSILQITYQIIFLTSGDVDFYQCAAPIKLAFEVLFAVYTIFVLFFIFKYINVIINEYRGAARFFLMHAMGTTLAIWIFTIVTETLGAILIAEEYETDTPGRVGCEGPEALNQIHRTISPYLYPFIIEFCILIVGIWYMIWSNISHCPKKLSALGHSHEDDHHHHQQNHHQHQHHDQKQDFNHNNHGQDNGGFDGHGTGVIASNNHNNNNNNRNNNNSHHGSIVDLEKANGNILMRAPSRTQSDDHCDTTVEHENIYKNQLAITADCHASMRGMFAGLVLLVLTIVFIILFFIAAHEEDYLTTGVLVNSIFYLTVLVIMLIAVIIAYIQTSRLDINHHPISKLDDFLLFIAVPAFFLETIFSMIPAIYNVSILNIFIICIQLIQILIQTPFIIDGLRRCANAPHLRKHKPGREFVTFLTIANVALWVFYTFSVKTTYTGDERYDFYGYTLWSILNHISLPLIMFYRFHSSVCLVDIWRHSYEPEPAGH